MNAGEVLDAAVVLAETIRAHPRHKMPSGAVSCHHVGGFTRFEGDAGYADHLAETITAALPHLSPRPDAEVVEHCRHGQPERDCGACTSCAACDGSCGVCPYSATPAPALVDAREALAAVLAEDGWPDELTGRIADAVLAAGYVKGGSGR